MNIKQNLWKSTVSSRGQDASVFNNAVGDSSLYPGHSPEIFARNLELLNKRIHSIHKDLTYWNLYKITTSVNSSTEFESVVAALAPGEACIINTNSFTSQGVDYSRGDVFVKTISNEIVYVPSVNSGFYFPSQINWNSETNSYNLKYSYAQGSSVLAGDQSLTLNNPTPLATPSQTITITGLQESHASTIYGEFHVVNSNSDYIKFSDTSGDLGLEAVYVSSSLVYPVIKFFVKTTVSGNDTYEEISGDYSVALYTDSGTNKKYWRIVCSFYDSTVFSNKLWIQVK